MASGIDYKQVIFCDVFGVEPFFKGKVQIFRAVGDVQVKEKVVMLYFLLFGHQVRKLYRSSAVAKAVGCTSSALAMYLSRRRTVDDGIFQAVSFQVHAFWFSFC